MAATFHNHAGDDQLAETQSHVFCLLARLNPGQAERGAARACSVPISTFSGATGGNERAMRHSDHDRTRSTVPGDSHVDVLLDATGMMLSKSLSRWKPHQSIHA